MDWAPLAQTFTGGALTILGGFIAEWLRGRESARDREQREATDHRADARRIRDAKAERLRALYVDVIRQGRLYHERAGGIAARDAVRRAREAGRDVRFPPGGSDAQLAAEWEEINTGSRLLSARLALEPDAQPIRAALNHLVEVTATYLDAFQHDEERDPTQTYADLQSGLDVLEQTARDSIAAVESPIG